VIDGLDDLRDGMRVQAAASGAGNTGAANQPTGDTR
jgi:hypothetical protein